MRQLSNWEKIRKQRFNNRLWRACRSGNLPEVKRLYNNGAKDDVRKARSGETPMWVACKNGHLDIIEFLHKNGASVSKLLNWLYNLSTSCTV